MKVVVGENAAASARLAADLIETYLRSHPSPVLGLATGSSVRPLYRELVRRHREEALSFAETQAFLLDEYVGLDPDHPQLYRNVIRAELTGHLDIDPARVHVPNVGAAELEKECVRYECHAIRAGIGIQVLGIGRNGHLAFNEPGSAFDSRTRIVRLTAETRIHNSRFFDSIDEVPQRALTQGLGTILQAEHLVVIASGSIKTDAVFKARFGPIIETVPASILRTHPRVTMILDPQSARLSESERKPGGNRPATICGPGAGRVNLEKREDPVPGS